MFWTSVGPQTELEISCGEVSLGYFLHSSLQRCKGDGLCLIFFPLILPQCWRGKGLATNEGEIQDKLTDKMFPFKTASIGSIYLVLHIHWILWKGLNRVSYLNFKLILGGRGYHNLHVIGQGTETQRRLVTYPNLVTSEQEFTCSHGQLYNSKGLAAPHTSSFAWPCTSCIYHLNFLALASLTCLVFQYFLEYIFGLY